MSLSSSNQWGSTAYLPSKYQVSLLVSERERSDAWGAQHSAGVVVEVPGWLCCCNSVTLSFLHLPLSGMGRDTSSCQFSVQKAGLCHSTNHNWPQQG